MKSQEHFDGYVLGVLTAMHFLAGILDEPTVAEDMVTDEALTMFDCNVSGKSCATEEREGGCLCFNCKKYKALRAALATTGDGQ